KGAGDGGQRAHALLHRSPAPPARAGREVTFDSSMDQEAVSPLPKVRVQERKPPARPLKRFWRRVRQPLARSRVVKALVVGLIAGAVKLVYRTNPAARGSDDVAAAVAAHTPAIAAFWHGQHIL